jgi:ABC-type multidrug transport system fused ATPase/permease subunit
MSETPSKRLSFTWRELDRFMRGSRWLFFGGLLLGLFDAAAQATVPLFFREVINAIQTDAAHFLENDLMRVVWAAVALLVLFLPAAYFFHVWFFVSIMRFCRNLQVELYRHIQRLSVDFFQRFQVGEINSRLNSDMEAVSASAGMLSFILVWAPAMLFYSFAMMFWINGSLALIAAVLLVLVTGLTIWAMPSLKRWNRQVRDTSGEASATITEYVSLFGLIKSFSREDHAEERVKAISDRLLHSRVRLTWYQNLFTDFMQTLTRFIAPLILLFVGAWWIGKGQLKIGDLTAFWGYWLQLGGLATGLVMSFSGLMATLAALDRILAFFRESPNVRDPETPVVLASVRGKIDFEHVCFSYPSKPGEEAPVLRDIHLTVHPGEHVAIVGPSGAGKSSLMTLAMRFYDPEQGTIRLDGVDIRDLRQHDLRTHLGMVMQESLFFAGSVADNLKLAKPEATEEELWDCLRAANAEIFVREMPQGILTLLGERGSRLSGGQKQRLAIARAFLKNPSVLLLDEPTSALDSKSEAHVKEALSRLLKGRTSIMIAHRLSTVIDADRIVVMDAGRVIATGSHERLRAEVPLYAELCESQGL